MAATYTPIATTTLGSAASSVTFSSISGSYTDLVVIINTGTTAGTGQPLRLQVNGDTTSNYSTTSLWGDGSSTGSARSSNTSMTDNIVGMDGNAGNYNQILHFMNYSNTTTYKTVLQRINRANASNFPATSAAVYLWRSTSAINKIDIFPSTSTLLAGSTFTLYGILAA